ncbi:hypothetical protein VT84_36505 [Gemmata sp. SH-PL17]|uniref:hypothetical protein n=1 Tax=Gemmata sp. SH-PL17 TaxID=1630693 RepID=UPI00078E9615|nr:hypothetical protein [Gemmata sp. SH-PL17]AMV29952.1 hypothetical protein VT84_36505 [Gemmata sp. SH-PL17]
MLVLRNLVVAITAALCVLISVSAAEPAVKSKPPETGGPAALLKAAKTAELHGIAVYEPTTVELRVRDVKDWAKLITTIRDGKGEAVARVREYTPEEVLKRAAEDEIIERLTQPTGRGMPESLKTGILKNDFVRRFNEILDDRDFYDEKTFKDVALDDGSAYLAKLGKTRTMHQTARLHWGVMKALFPDSIPDIPADFRTIRVQVRDEKEVVLVLSCTTPCFWNVDVKPGSKVTGVILCGCRAQEIDLFENPVKDAPIVYRAAYATDGTRLPSECLDGYETSEDPTRKFKVRERFEAGVKELTEKSEFVSMRREYAPKSGAYTIPPKKK